MSLTRWNHRRRMILALPLLMTAPPALAQAASVAPTEVVAPATPNADKLADEMRVLAQSPKDLRALISAGDLSAKLNDPAAALAFFARAEAVAPNDPRISAGKARALVQLGHPGEALRLFSEAERAGAPVADFAAARGFAYDLIGASANAQADYRLALSRDPADRETIRRYALSLGISGDREAAMAALDPLLRQQDRAAWRARAFILAMTGDAAGATKIAQGMMPGNFGNALEPFFQRLSEMPAADRAFAVHFGELSRTPEHLADARLAPPIPHVEPRRVALASADTQRAAPQRRARDRKPAPRSRRRNADDRGELAPAAAATGTLRAAAEKSVVIPTATGSVSAPPVQAATAPSGSVANAAAQPTPPSAPAPQPAIMALRQPVLPAVRPTAAGDVEQASPVRPTRGEAASPPPSRVVQSAAVAASAPAGPPDRGALPRAIQSVSVPASAAVPMAATPPAPAPTRPPEATASDDPLAAIIRNLAAQSQSEAATRSGTAASRSDSATGRREAQKPQAKLAKPAAEAVAKPDKAAKPEKPAAKKLAEKKPPAKPDPAKAEPSRIWVQVAGGANEDMLARAYRKRVDANPALYKGRQAWTTPLRATHRVLVGPFKDKGDAQDFVNALAKAGASGFIFVSEAGQKIEKLPVK